MSILLKNNVKFNLLSLLLKYFKIHGWIIDFQNLWSVYSQLHPNYHIKVMANLQIIDKKSDNGAGVWISFVGWVTTIKC